MEKPILIMSNRTKCGVVIPGFRHSQVSCKPCLRDCHLLSIAWRLSQLREFLRDKWGRTYYKGENTKFRTGKLSFDSWSNLIPSLHLIWFTCKKWSPRPTSGLCRYDSGGLKYIFPVGKKTNNIIPFRKTLRTCYNVPHILSFKCFSSGITYSSKGR